MAISVEAQVVEVVSPMGVVVLHSSVQQVSTQPFLEHLVAMAQLLLILVAAVAEEQTLQEVMVLGIMVAQAARVMTLLYGWANLLAQHIEVVVAAGERRRC